MKQSVYASTRVRLLAAIHGKGPSMGPSITTAALGLAEPFEKAIGFQTSLFPRIRDTNALLKDVTKNIEQTGGLGTDTPNQT